MECADVRWRLVAYLFKLLNETEKNYEIYDKEMLAVVRGLKAQRYLLEDTKFKFEIRIDHKILEYSIKVQKLNWRQAIWALYLSKFDFTLKHVPGVRMGKVNELSRRLDLKVEIKKNNENQKLIKKEWIREMIKVVVKRLDII